MMIRLLALCLVASTLVAAQAEPSSEAARLTCYNVDWPRTGPSPGPSTATATSFPITADSDTCVRYSATCDSDCGEVPVGTTVWVYGVVSAANCETMKSNSWAYQNVQCCSTDLCNKPDPALDSDTTAVDSPVLIMEGQPPASPSPDTPAAAASPSPSPAAASSPLPEAVKTNSSAAMLTCYNVVWPESGPLPGPSTATATSFPITADVDICVRYSFTCAKGDSSCSGFPVGTTKWAYTIVSAATCESLKSSGMAYQNVLCCSSDLCNKPDPSLDPDTTAVDSPVLIIGAQPQSPASPSPAAAAAPSPMGGLVSPPSASPLSAAAAAKATSSAGRSGSSLLLLAVAVAGAALGVMCI